MMKVKESGACLYMERSERAVVERGSHTKEREGSQGIRNVECFTRWDISPSLTLSQIHAVSSYVGTWLHSGFDLNSVF
ncbi:conserved hypothetical protein [Ricinus communis]|uniref:Uncharacterized protein n=1 Tax=Ricinus communis TaxID=3988 RepID=B9S9F3_RICCO|nr:conserved hypothetical protein [Ricinus communis]